MTTVPSTFFKPYPAYKDSGVEWLGEIPAHWEVRRLKFLLAAPLKYGANEAAELDDPELPRYVRITDIDESDGLRDETFKSLPVDVAEEYLLREGDLLFARSGATAGKTFLYRRSWGTCAYAGYLIRARLDTSIACPNFVRYFTGSSCYWQWLSAAFIQATIQNVSAEKYASLMIPQPSIPEQRAIAAFLDRETARIDALVRKVRAAVERLKELRTCPHLRRGDGQDRRAGGDRMSPEISKRSFEEAIECALLAHGPDACAGDATVFSNRAACANMDLGCFHGRKQGSR